MADALSREWNLDALTAAGAPMPRETLRFGSNGAIRCVTLDNGSNCDVGIYLDRDPFGQPSFIVAAGTYKTNPCNARIVGVAFKSPVGDQPRGSAYAQLTDEALSASSGVSSSGSSANAVWDQATYDSGARQGP